MTEPADVSPDSGHDSVSILWRPAPDLAAAVGAFLIVSADAGLTSMSPWRGRPIVEPSQFASLVDASRRVRRRR